MGSLPLFWFSKEKLQGIATKNFGDDINPLLIEKITGKKILWKNPDQQTWYERNFTKINFAIGSVIHYATNNAVIWGSGLIDSASKFPQKAKYLAVRGPETYKILKNAGCKINPVFGDPALLLPKYFEGSTTKKYKLGIIPHYVEVDDFLHNNPNLPNDIKVIDLKGNVLSVLEEITSCEKIISSSLHGIIVGMAYQIPSLRMKISEKIYGDGIKYEDYYQSIGIPKHTIWNVDPKKLNINEILNHFDTHKNESLIQTDLQKIQEKLLNVMPF